MWMVSLALGVLAIGLSAWIAIRQHKQLKELEKIGRETVAIATKLRTETYAEEIVRGFFSISREREERYKCVFPVHYDKRPLPFILAGDYNALHALQDLIGTDRLELKPIAVNPLEKNPVVPQECLEGDSIYLCTPDNNLALGSLAPSVRLTASGRPSDPLFNGIKLPCWFAIDERGAKATKKIWIASLNKELESSAEEDYEEASKLKEWEVYSPSSGLQTDLAILLRLTDGRRKVIVVAGIHQYGTWIGGDFFRRLAAGQELSYRDVFLADNDFLAIVWGQFNSKKFTVERCDVSEEYLWIRKGAEWERVPPEPATPQRP